MVMRALLGRRRFRAHHMMAPSKGPKTNSRRCEPTKNHATDRTSKQVSAYGAPPQELKTKRTTALKARFIDRRFVSEIPSSNFQINLKCQYSNSNASAGSTVTVSGKGWVVGLWRLLFDDLRFIWSLGIGDSLFNNRCTDLGEWRLPRWDGCGRKKAWDVDLGYF